MSLHVFVRTLGIQGGTERFTHGFVRWAISQNKRIVIHCTKVEKPIKGARVELFPLHSRGRIPKMLELDWRLRQFKLGESQALSMIRGGTPKLYRAGGGCHAHWMKKSRGSLGGFLEQKIDERVCRGAQKIIVNANRSIDLLEEYYDIRREKCFLLRNGVDERRFSPKGPTVNSSTPRLIFVGNNFQRKGLDIVLKWMKALPKWRLWVLGSHPNSNRFKKLSVKLGVSERVDWIGRVDEPEKWLRSADLCVLPTRYDPAANVCLEALACGTPVLTSHENGSSELLWEDWMTWTFGTDIDVESVAKHVLNQRENLRQESRAVALQNSQEKCYQTLWDICNL